jgi:hypothetical protein
VGIGKFEEIISGCAENTLHRSDEDEIPPKMLASQLAESASVFIDF